MTDVGPPSSRALARRGLLGLFAFLVGFGASVAAVRLSQDDGPEVRGTPLGPIDVNSYCRRNHGPTAIPVLIRRDANGWQCALRDNGIFGTAEFDYDGGCTEQYGQLAHGDSTNLSWPYLWQCVAGPPPAV